MKRIYFLLLVAIAAMTAMPADAQIQFGIKAGLDVTQLSLNKDIVDKDNRAGFFIGPTVKASLLDTGFGLDASVLYDQRSAKFEETVYVNDQPGGAEREVKESETVTQKQIAIPINVRYAWGIGSTANIFIFAGPQFGFNVGGDKDDINWKWKDSNFSVNVGLGCTLLSHLQVNVNYNIVCGKTGEVKNAFDAAGDAIGNVRGRYNAWQIGLAYYF